MAYPHSYITRFFGMHRIKVPHLRKKVHFVVMQSVFHGSNPIHRMYDLKGSSVGRAASDKEKVGAAMQAGALLLRAAAFVPTCLHFNSCSATTSACTRTSTSSRTGSASSSGRGGGRRSSPRCVRAPGGGL